MSQNFYFEPPSRIQLVDKMAHLLRYSDFLVVIAGPKGSGKSSVAQRLALVTHASDISQIIVSLESETGALALALQCAKLVSDEYVDGMDPLTILHEKSRALHDVGQHLLILIDNAEWLNDEAIELLAGLLVSGVGKPKVVLSGEESLVKRLNSLSLYELLEGRLHLERLQPFTEDEAKEFLALRFSSQQDLNKRELKQVFEASSGYPGRLTSAASELYRSGKVVSRAAVLPLPIPHIVGIGIVLLGVLLISVWQVFQVDEADLQPQIVEGRVSVPLSMTLDSSRPEVTAAESVNVVQSELSKLLADQERLLRQELALTQNSNTDADKNDVVTTTLPLSVPAVRSIDDTAVIQEPKESEVLIDEPVVVVKVPQQAVAEPEVLVSKPVIIEPEPVVIQREPVIIEKAPVKPAIVVASKPKPVEAAPVAVKEIVKAAPKAVVKEAPKAVAKVNTESRSKVAKPALSGAQKWLKEEQLLSWPSGGYTLQLLGARSENSVVQFMESLDNPNRLYYFSTVYKNAPWHVVVYGQYANRTAANRAVSSLPEELKKLKPWARSINGVQQDIKKK
ncbi:AAA family ATPase [Neptunomonas qingdaonensis]|uniref:Cell division protein DamX, binds to the septal ring, contains C-terminal SPOR domain n=1 Tax=Neptunomonas qingdaonensis TaxID=1045558 RepID=A0A1I2MBM6_9GAMM|nr:AAA family ATPase [Neptunomonas qingdaonensis]SFF86641.1 Cell division protein DamX, binds to the septal ring, contains C-terminal SPOR domain [Neptunomonas qingdaonensis]